MGKTGWWLPILKKNFISSLAYSLLEKQWGYMDICKGYQVIRIVNW